MFSAWLIATPMLAQLDPTTPPNPPQAELGSLSTLSPFRISSSSFLPVLSQFIFLMSAEMDANPAPPFCLLDPASLGSSLLPLSECLLWCVAAPHSLSAFFLIWGPLRTNFFLRPFHHTGDCSLALLTLGQHATSKATCAALFFYFSYFEIGSR